MHNSTQFLSCTIDTSYFEKQIVQFAIPYQVWTLDSQESRSGVHHQNTSHHLQELHPRFNFFGHQCSTCTWSYIILSQGLIGLTIILISCWTWTLIPNDHQASVFFVSWHWLSKFIMSFLIFEFFCVRCDIF